MLWSRYKVLCEIDAYNEHRVLNECDHCFGMIDTGVSVGPLNQIALNEAASVNIVIYTGVSTITFTRINIALYEGYARFSKIYIY